MRRSRETRDAGEGQINHASPVTASVGPEMLQRELQEVYGLSLYEAKLLLALVQVGRANSTRLAQLAKLPRTSTYPVIEALGAKGLVERIPGDGVAQWASPGLDAVLERLEAAHEDDERQRQRLFEARATQLRTLLEEGLSPSPATAVSNVQVIHGAARVKTAYDRLLGAARIELQMMTRPPYTAPPGYINPAVMAMLSRGVRARALYDRVEDGSPDFRVAYHQAGVEARVVPHLPLKLVIVDHRVALVGMEDPVDPDSYPTTLHIEHLAFAELAGAAFELYWTQGRRYTPPGSPQPQTG